MIGDMHTKKRAARPRTPPSSSVPARSLHFLEQCERGLVEAYRALPDGVLSRADASRLAALHQRHADLLADRIHRDGGRSARNPYDQWITEATISGMRFAEESSFATYRDHLATLAPSAAHMIRTRIMPDHYRAAEHLAEVAARRGRTWRRSIHTATSARMTSARQPSANAARARATRPRRLRQRAAR